MYDIRFDPERRLLNVVAEGFWTIQTLASFSVAALGQATAIRLRHGAFAVLIDARGMPVQSTDTAARMGTLSVQAAKITGGPMATVAPSVLSKLQGNRVMTPGMQIFTDWDEAQAWLDACWPRRKAA